MRNTTLHSVLEAFTADAAGQLAAETASGAEIPFEVIETEGRPGRAALYCYRPLTGAFIRERLGLLCALPTYAPAARALAGLEGVEAYLRESGEPRISGEPRERADAALKLFLGRVFAERSEFGFDPLRFEVAYEELEHALYDGRSVTIVVAPLLGIALDPATTELALGDGLALVRGARRCPGGGGLGGARPGREARRGAERARASLDVAGALGPGSCVDRSQPLQAHPDGGAAVRAGRLRARTGRMGANRHGRLASSRVRQQRPASIRHPDHGRSGG